MTALLTSRSRQRRYRRFIDEMRPREGDTILDVGVTDSAWRSGNFLEATYPAPERITAVGLGPLSEFRRLFPTVTTVTADGRDLPFRDEEFTLGFSNAVIEHVGSREEQRRFAHELVRTCRRAFIATPNRWFPIDPHTLLPFVHWLPRALRDRVLRSTGNGRWAGEAELNPLGAGDLASLFPPRTRVRIVRQRVLGLTTVLIAIAERERE
ncbi:MAG: class I SAM-dependent methyltransferase [Chloroflexota bacterium]